MFWERGERGLLVYEAIGGEGMELGVTQSGLVGLRGSWEESLGTAGNRLHTACRLKRGMCEEHRHSRG